MPRDTSSPLGELSRRICPKCERLGYALDPDAGSFDHYRCDACDHVWAFENNPEAPPVTVKDPEGQLGHVVTNEEPCELTLELVGAGRDNEAERGEPLLYQVHGMSPGYSAQVRNSTGFAWQYRFELNGRLSEWSGNYRSPDEVLEDIGDLFRFLRRVTSHPDPDLSQK